MLLNDKKIFFHKLYMLAPCISQVSSAWLPLFFPRSEPWDDFLPGIAGVSKMAAAWIMHQQSQHLATQKSPFLQFCNVIEKTANILWRHHWCPRRITSEKQGWKWHTKIWEMAFWLVVLLGKCGSTNQKHYPDLGIEVSSVWNFYSCSIGVISQGSQLRHHKMSVVFSGSQFCGL